MSTWVKTTSKNITKIYLNAEARLHTKLIWCMFSPLELYLQNYKVHNTIFFVYTNQYYQRSAVK